MSLFLSGEPRHGRRRHEGRLDFSNITFLAGVRGGRRCLRAGLCAVCCLTPLAGKNSEPWNYGAGSAWLWPEWSRLDEQFFQYMTPIMDRWAVVVGIGLSALSVVLVTVMLFMH